MPFVKGQSGNPAGRPVGSRNRFTREMDEALEKTGLPLIEAIVAHAHAANPAAMRLCLDRLLPMGRNRPAAIELPLVETPDYTCAALGEIHRALGAGEMSTDEATRLVGFVDRTTRVLAGKAVAEIDLADRLAHCEEALTKCMVLLGLPAPVAETMSEPEPTAVETAAARPAIASNNAETMDPTAAPAGPAEPPPIARNNETPAAAMSAGGAALPGPSDVRLPRRNRGGAIGRLMDSTSPLAHLGGASLGKTPPAMPPRVPLAGAA